MKHYLIAFLIAAVLMAAEDALASKCRSALWGGVLPLAALLGSAALFILGPLPLEACYIAPFVAVNSILWLLWAGGREKRRKRAKETREEITAEN